MNYDELTGYHQATRRMDELLTELHTQVRLTERMNEQQLCDLMVREGIGYTDAKEAARLIIRARYGAAVSLASLIPEVDVLGNRIKDVLDQMEQVRRVRRY